MSLVQLTVRNGKASYGTTAPVLRASAQPTVADGAAFAIDVDGNSGITKAMSVKLNGTEVWQLNTAGVPTFGGGGPATMTFTNVTNINSGLRGLHLNRPVTEGTPHGISFDISGTPTWEIGSDAATVANPDAVLCYSHLLQADTLRIRLDTGQTILGRVVGQPPLGGPQLGIEGGNAGNPVDVLSLTTQSATKYCLQLLSGVNPATSKRVKIVFQAQSTTGFQMGTDSANNGTNDFWLSNNATGTFPLLVSAADAVTIGASGGSVKVVGNVGFYNTTPVAKPTVSGSRSANAALASLLTALASQGLITDSSSA